MGTNGNETDDKAADAKKEADEIKESKGNKKAEGLKKMDKSKDKIKAKDAGDTGDAAGFDKESKSDTKKDNKADKKEDLTAEPEKDTKADKKEDLTAETKKDTKVESKADSETNTIANNKKSDKKDEENKSPITPVTESKNEPNTESTKSKSEDESEADTESTKAKDETEDETEDENDMEDLEPGIEGEPYETPRTEYPKFHQVSNGCGLSSMLMMLDPILHEDLAEFLDAVWDGVKNILFQSNISQKEFRWSYVLEYLLQKMYPENPISEYLMEHQMDYDIFRPTLEFDLMGFKQGHLNAGRKLVADAYQRFLDEGISNHFMLIDHITKMKTNLELKMLFEIFGYEFMPQYIEGMENDGTGSIWFTKQEIKNWEADDVLKRFKILKTEKNRGALIMLGQYHHWLAITNVIRTKKGYKFMVNDPMTASTYSLSYKKLDDTDRFYLYKKKNLDMHELWVKILTYLKGEFPKEKEYRDQLLEMVKKEIEKQKAKQKEMQLKKEAELKAMESTAATGQATAGSGGLTVGKKKSVKTISLKPLSSESGGKFPGGVGVSSNSALQGVPKKIEVNPRISGIKPVQIEVNRDGETGTDTDKETSISLSSDDEKEKLKGIIRKHFSDYYEI